MPDTQPRLVLVNAVRADHGQYCGRVIDAATGEVMYLATSRFGTGAKRQARADAEAWARECGYTVKGE